MYETVHLFDGKEEEWSVFFLWKKREKRKKRKEAEISIVMQTFEDKCKCEKDGLPPILDEEAPPDPTRLDISTSYSSLIHAYELFSPFPLPII